MSLDRVVFPISKYPAFLRLLLAQDGSTTRTCEALAQEFVQLVVHRQRQTQEVPLAVRSLLGGERWLERVTSLCLGPTVLMDNLTFTRLDAVPSWFLQQLEIGQAPIGHLFQQLFVQRHPFPLDPALAHLLWVEVGTQDNAACRNYKVVMPQGPLMLICEVFRGGLVDIYESNPCEKPAELLSPYKLDGSES
jgi:chorismate-pyruvate lyase